MKDYLSEIVDLTRDQYLNPVGAQYGDGSGAHQRAVGRITSIAIHHDASVRPHEYDSIARYHQEAQTHYDRLGPGLQYHFKIDNTGVIFRIRPLTTWLYAVGSSENTSSISICLDGYFHPPYNQVPTREQFEALGQLLVNLCEEHPEFPATYKDVRPHRDFSSTACPGDNLVPWVYAIQNKADVLNIPANAAYDWPELQPSAQANAQPQTAPTPTVPDQAHPEPTAPSSTAPPVDGITPGTPGPSSGASSSVVVGGSNVPSVGPSIPVPAGSTPPSIPLPPLTTLPSSGPKPDQSSFLTLLNVKSILQSISGIKMFKFNKTIIAVVGVAVQVAFAVFGVDNTVVTAAVGLLFALGVYQVPNAK